jgi:hypothetical protein
MFTAELQAHIAAGHNAAAAGHVEAAVALFMRLVKAPALEEFLSLPAYEALQP